MIKRTKNGWALVAETLLRCGVLMLLASGLAQAQEKVVFEDTFSSGVNGWKQLAIASPVAKTLPSGLTGMMLNNRVAGRALNSPVKNQFTLDVKAMHGGDGAAAWFGLFDSLAEKGYVIFWECLPSQEGKVSSRASLYKVHITESQPFNLHLKGAEKLVSAHPCEIASPVEAPPTTFTLSWNKAANELIFSVNGKELGRTNDSSIQEFGSVVLSGNKNTFYQSVTVKGD